MVVTADMDLLVLRRKNESRFKLQEDVKVSAHFAELVGAETGTSVSWSHWKTPIDVFVKTIAEGPKYSDALLAVSQLYRMISGATLSGDRWHISERVCLMETLIATCRKLKCDDEFKPTLAHGLQVLRAGHIELGRRTPDALRSELVRMFRTSTTDSLSDRLRELQQEEAPPEVPEDAVNSEILEARKLLAAAGCRDIFHLLAVALNRSTHRRQCFLIFVILPYREAPPVVVCSEDDRGVRNIFQPEGYEGYEVWLRVE